MDKTVLAYIKKDGQFLMLYRNKKEHDINKGKWIGIGGHIEEGETKEQALVREIKEETGLNVLHYIYRGELLFVNNDFEEVMYLYLVDDISGNVIDCDEGELAWVKQNDLMSLNMWEGDYKFLPLLINTDEFIRLELRYCDDQLVEVKEWS
ncbi:MAG: 8-oxo-dGTP diphosphatase [Bacilli bacterium]|nr:8-oxo-dGTP diphosphatase [Bacilli bacterium]